MHTQVTRMWANAQRDGRHAEYRWHPLLNAAKFGWFPLLECRVVTLTTYENARLGRKVNFAPGKIPSGGNIPWKCIHSVPVQETAKHCAKFGWPPVSDVAALTKARCEICWNLLGYPKLPNRSQLLVGRSSPYCGDMWRTYCCLTSFSDCRCMP